MSTIVKVQKKGQVTLPMRLRSQAGIADGDLMEVTFQRGKIILTPKVRVDRSQFPNADDEYTPAQRRIIDRAIARSMKEYRQGKCSGPFDTAEEFLAGLHKASAKLNARVTRDWRFYFMIEGDAYVLHEIRIHPK